MVKTAKNSDLIINNFDKENCLTKHDAIIFIEEIENGC
jgi:hypothetical protein